MYRGVTGDLNGQLYINGVKAKKEMKVDMEMYKVECDKNHMKRGK